MQTAIIYFSKNSESFLPLVCFSFRIFSRITYVFLLSIQSTNFPLPSYVVKTETTKINPDRTSNFLSVSFLHRQNKYVGDPYLIRLPFYINQYVVFTRLFNSQLTRKIKSLAMFLKHFTCSVNICNKSSNISLMVNGHSLQIITLFFSNNFFITFYNTFLFNL